jgi:hypothetical protein
MIASPPHRRQSAPAEKLEQNFIDFSLKEGAPLQEAQQRAAALKRALTSSGATT